MIKFSIITLVLGLLAIWLAPYIGKAAMCAWKYITIGYNEETSETGEKQE